MVDEILTTIARPGGEELRLTLSDYKGHRFINARIWYSAGGGEMRPGRQGVTIPLWAIPDMREALDQAEAIAVRDGLLKESAHAGPRH